MREAIRSDIAAPASVKTPSGLLHGCLGVAQKGSQWGSNRQNEPDYHIEYAAVRYNPIRNLWRNAAEILQSPDLQVGKYLIGGERGIRTLDGAFNPILP